jgi:hypothetical protein
VIFLAEHTPAPGDPQLGHRHNLNSATNFAGSRAPPVKTRNRVQVVDPGRLNKQVFLCDNAKGLRQFRSLGMSIECSLVFVPGVPRQDLLRTLSGKASWRLYHSRFLEHEDRGFALPLLGAKIPKGVRFILLNPGAEFGAYFGGLGGDALAGAAKGWLTQYIRDRPCQVLGSRWR